VYIEQAELDDLMGTLPLREFLPLVKKHLGHDVTLEVIGDHHKVLALTLSITALKANNICSSFIQPFSTFILNRLSTT
jgi:hypothetical protein